MPGGVGSLGDVGGRGVGIGVGMGVEDPDDLQTAGLGVAIRPEVVLGIDRVGPGRGGRVPRRIADGDLGARRVAPEEPAGFVR